ncbi:MAG: lytic transglycosylase domain-containing protein [Paludibacteraceae bacterium]|nr:lytic transglycosylase domain-containing protein [Paludibacteraceae bacterium]
MQYKRIIFVLSIICVTFACAKGEDNDGQREEMVGGKEYITGVEMPDSVVFCDKTYHFDDEDMYERMDRELISFKYNHMTSILIYKKFPRYGERIKKILKENGVPEDFVYLAVIESNFNENARSGVGAGGFWQFMESTAKLYGLEVSETVDERYDIDKATAAACNYFKESYDKFGDWMAVAASYNAGMGRINSFMTKQHETDAMKLWMTTETSRYLYRILAAKTFIEEPWRFDYYINEDDRYHEIETREIEVKCSISSLQDWAIEHDASYRELKILNRWLTKSNLENKKGKIYKIKLNAKQK